MKLTCWFCDGALDPVDVLADGILEPRETSLGGPLYRFRCPACRHENICERNARKRFLARPRRPVPIFDRVQALGDPDLAREDARRRAWWTKNQGRIEWFHREFVETLDAGLWEEPLETAGDADESPAGPASPGPAPAAPAGTAIADPYAVLGVSRTASREEVVAAFRRLAKEHHPDLFATRDAAAQEAAHRRFVEILDAYARVREALGS